MDGWAASGDESWYVDGVLAVLTIFMAQACDPLPPSTLVVPVLTDPAPRLARYGPLARALIADASPFELTSEADTFRALHSEAGLRLRQESLARAKSMIRQAEGLFAELEDGLALELIAKATPLLVEVNGEPEGVRLFAQANLLAGSIFFARGQYDAAAKRLRRAIDLEPDLRPSSNRQLVGAVESVRAAEAQRDIGRLEVKLVETATSASIWVDGRKVGTTASKFISVPVGRHVIRVFSPGYRSFITTSQIFGGRATELYVSLEPDPVLGSIKTLGPRLAGGLALDEIQQTISKRAGANRTLVSALVAASVRGADGSSVAPALLLDLEGRGRVLIEPLTRDGVREALVELGSCQTATVTETQAPFAPALAANTLARGQPSERRKDPSPWLWVGLGVVLVGTVAAVAAVQGTNAPPEGANITLIPRP